MSPRLLLAGSVAGAILVLYLLWQGASAQRDVARRAVEQAEAQAATRDAAGAIEEAGARAVQRSLEREVRITVQAKEAAHEIRQAAGAEARLPPDLLSGWAGAIDRLRDEAAAGHSVVAASDAPVRAGSVSAAD